MVLFFSMLFLIDIILPRYFSWRNKFFFFIFLNSISIVYDPKRNKIWHACLWLLRNEMRKKIKSVNINRNINNNNKCYLLVKCISQTGVPRFSFLSSSSALHCFFKCSISLYSTIRRAWKQEFYYFFIRRKVEPVKKILIFFVIMNSKW